MLKERFMNTILADTPSGSRAAHQAARVFGAGDLMAYPRCARPEWLPAPPASRALSATRSIPGRGFKTSLGWVYGFGPTPAERFLFGLVAGVSLVAIGYGLASMLDLVQHWGLFNTGVERLVH